MGKSARTQARSTREKVAASRAAARRADRRRRFLLAGGGIALVVVLALVLIVVKPGQSPAAAVAGASTGTAAQDQAVSREVTSVPAATFNAVGAGTAAGLTTISGPALTSGGKPEVLYMGGEFCPYCAAERWALAAALSRFGTFTGLSLIHSSPTDAYPSTPTLSFYKSTYTSKYLSFTPVEWYGEAQDASTPFGHVYLQQPTAAEAALFSKYAGSSSADGSGGRALQQVRGLVHPVHRHRQPLPGRRAVPPLGTERHDLGAGGGRDADAVQCGCQGH